MQIVNIILFWIFFGYLAAYFARKKGRNPKTWFIVGICLGLLGVIVILLLPKQLPKQNVVLEAKVTPLRQGPKNPSLDKIWFYLDQNKSRQGPFYYDDFLQRWKKGEMKSDSYVWAEGMAGWKKIDELPELVEEFTS